MSIGCRNARFSCQETGRVTAAQPTDVLTAGWSQVLRPGSPYPQPILHIVQVPGQAVAHAARVFLDAVHLVKWYRTAARRGLRRAGTSSLASQPRRRARGPSPASGRRSRGRDGIRAGRLGRRDAPDRRRPPCDRAVDRRAVAFAERAGPGAAARDPSRRPSIRTAPLRPNAYVGISACIA